MREESFSHRIQTYDPDLETRVALLRKRAEQNKIKLQREVALYIAQNVRSNKSALDGVLMRLKAHSSLTGTEITLKYTQQVLANFIAAEAAQAAVDHRQKLLAQLFGTTEAKITGPDLTAADPHFVFCLVKRRDVRKASRVRHELEVNLRESERERLTLWDAYERDLERRAKRQKRQG